MPPTNRLKKTHAYLLFLLLHNETTLVIIKCNRLSGPLKSVLAPNTPISINLKTVRQAFDQVIVIDTKKREI